MADNIHKQLMRIRRKVQEEKILSLSTVTRMTSKHDIGKSVLKLMNQVAKETLFNDFEDVCKTCKGDAALLFIDACIKENDKVS